MHGSSGKSNQFLQHFAVKRPRKKVYSTQTIRSTHNPAQLCPRVRCQTEENGRSNVRKCQTLSCLARSPSAHKPHKLASRTFRGMSERQHTGFAATVSVFHHTCSFYLPLMCICRNRTRLCVNINTNLKLLCKSPELN